MPRVVHVADSHFCEASRFDECIAMHNWITDWAVSNRADLVVHSGDLFERRSTPAERDAAAGWLQSLPCPVVLVRGNHDPDGDDDFMRRLHSIHGIHTAESPRILCAGGVHVACLPWPRKSALLAMIGDVPQEQAGRVAQEALRDVLRGLGSQLGELDQETGARLPRLLVAHAMVRGSVTSHGQPLIGSDMELGIEDLALARCDGYALGHIHRHQWWDVGGGQAVYPGSPRRTAFGEVEEKGFVVWDMDDTLAASWEFVPLPCTPMILVETEWHDLHFGISGAVDPGFCTFDEPEARGAEIRFRYHVASEHREAAAREASAIRDRWLSRGAVSVKIDPIIEVTTRARAPEVARATSLEEQLDAHWQSTGGVPARREQLLAKLEEIDA